MWKIITFICGLSFFNLFIIYRNNLNRYLLYIYKLRINKKKRKKNTTEVQTTSGYYNCHSTTMTNVHDSYKLVKNERKRSG